MKAVFMNNPNEISIKEVSRPVLRDGYALIKCFSMGICGSDIGAYRGTNPLVTYPRIIGHEVAGEIVEICGESYGHNIGDRVVIDPYLYCGKCHPCEINRNNCCEHLKVRGVHIDGGMSEYFIHPTNMLVQIPDSIPWELAPLAEPLTIALHSLHRGEVHKGSFVVIFGAGAIGLLSALAAKHYGAKPILVDIVNERLSYAQSLGIDYVVNSAADLIVECVYEITKGRMAETVIEASGANAAIRSALDIVSHAGIVVLTGWPKKETSIPTDLITRKEIDIRGSRNSRNEFHEALELISSGAVNVRDVLSKVVPMSEIPSAVRTLSANPGQYIKIVGIV